MSLRSTDVDARPRARGRRRASLVTLVALVVLLVGGTALARSPVSPVREWAVHVPEPVVSIALERPDESPDAFTPGRPLDLPLVLRRDGDPPGGDDAVSWQARFVPDDGAPPTALDEGSSSVPTGSATDLPLSVVIDDDAPGRLVVALDTGASVDVGLSPTDDRVTGAARSAEGAPGAPGAQEETRG